MCRTDPYREAKDVPTPTKVHRMDLRDDVIHGESVPPFSPAEAKPFPHCMNWMYDPKAGKRVYCVHKPGHKSPCKFGSK